MLTKEQFVKLLNNDATARGQLARLNAAIELADIDEAVYEKMRENIVLSAILRNPTLIDDLAEQVYNEINGLDPKWFFDMRVLEAQGRRGMIRTPPPHFYFLAMYTGWMQNVTFHSIVTFHTRNEPRH